MSLSFERCSTPVGDLYLVADQKKLRGVVFAKNWKSFKRNFADAVEGENTILKRTKRQLAEYFAGKRTSFDLPYELYGTPFQKQVWQALAKIPYGKTKSYKEQAVLVKSPKAVRAVGRTNGLNPISIVLPCHRVIGSNGALTGYGGGLEVKKFLLRLESERVDLSK